MFAYFFQNIREARRGKPASMLSWSVQSRPNAPIIFIAAVLIVAGLVLLLMPDTPYTIEAQGQLLPVKEWMVTRTADAYLTATLYNHALGTPESFSVAQFERQDAMRFTFNSAVTRGDYIRAGDTVGTMHSSQVNRELARLQGQLATERATLNLYAAGEKTSTVAEAQRQVSRAELLVREQEKIVARLKTLQDKGITSDQELEVEEGTLRIYQSEVEIARARLQSVRTGAKPEQLDLIRARIAGLESEIEAVGQRAENFTLVSPIDGALYMRTQSDTLLVVADTSRFVVFMPVAWDERPYLAEGQEVLLESPGLPEAYPGRLIRMENYVRTMGGMQGFMVMAEVRPDAYLLPGIMVRCTIVSDPVSPLEQVKRFFKSSLPADQ